MGALEECVEPPKRWNHPDACYAYSYGVCQQDTFGGGGLSQGEPWEDVRVLGNSPAQSSAVTARAAERRTTRNLRRHMSIREPTPAATESAARGRAGPASN